MVNQNCQQPVHLENHVLAMASNNHAFGPRGLRNEDEMLHNNWIPREDSNLN